MPRLTLSQASALNAIAREHDRTRLLSSGLARRRGASFTHPWQTGVARHGEGLWRVNVAAGTVNDELALYTYATTGDPRGWTMPTDYVSAGDLSAYGDNFPVVDRSPLESEDPPFLLVRAPEADGVDPGDFEAVSAGSRPQYFRGSGVPGISGLGRVGGATNARVGPDIGEWPLYRAYVIASATPFRASRDFTPFRAELTVRLQRFRLFAGRRPTPTDGVQAGGATELARLYLLRDPERPVALDRLYVQQLKFWCLQSVPVQPSFEIGEIKESFADFAAIFGGAGIGEALASIFLDPVQADLESAATIEFWTA